MRGGHFTVALRRQGCNGSARSSRRIGCLIPVPISRHRLDAALEPDHPSDIEEMMRDFGVGAAAIGNLSAFYFYGYAGLQIPFGISRQVACGDAAREVQRSGELAGLAK